MRADLNVGRNHRFMKYSQPMPNSISASAKSHHDQLAAAVCKTSSPITLLHWRHWPICKMICKPALKSPAFTRHANGSWSPRQYRPLKKGPYDFRVNPIISLTLRSLISDVPRWIFKLRNSFESISIKL